MKRFILVFLMILLVSATVQSQILHNFGLKGGILFSGFTTDSDDKVFADSSYIVNFLSYDIGLYAELFSGKKFSVLTELHYNVKGERNPNFVKIITSQPGPQGAVFSHNYLSDRFHYLSLQVLPRYKFLITAEDVLFLSGGLSYDYRISSSNSENPNATILADKPGGEIAGILAIGGEYRQVVTFEFRFQHNFTPTYTFQYGDRKVTRISNSIVFQFGLSFKKIFKM